MRLTYKSLLAAAGLLMLAGSTKAATIDWSGYKWEVNSNDRIGQGLVRGSLSNVLIDANGYLHLRMDQQDGKWCGAETWTTEPLGYGTFYWVFDGPLTTMEPQIVLAGFTYGPQIHQGTDCQNEIDVEFSKWNNPDNKNNGDFDDYGPPPAVRGDDAENDWNFTGGNVATIRVEWSADKIVQSVWNGVVPIDAPTSTAAVTWTNTKTKSIPLVACPFMFNLWTFKTLPTKSMEAVVRDFKYVAAPKAETK